MSESAHHRSTEAYDAAPGDQEIGGGAAHGVGTYLIGLALAAGLTAASFYVAESTVIWRPGIPAALIVLAIAQMGVHLVFFLHITTGPESTNNVLALAFGVLIVFLIIAGSLWIMSHMNANMMRMPPSMRMPQ